MTDGSMEGKICIKLRLNIKKLLFTHIEKERNCCRSFFICAMKREYISNINLRTGTISDNYRKYNPLNFSYFAIKEKFRAIFVK